MPPNTGKAENTISSVILQMSGTCSGLVASPSPLEGGRFERQSGVSIITLNPIMDLQQWAMPVQSAEGLHKNNQMCLWARPPINSYYCLLIFTDYNKMPQKARVRTVCEALTATHNSMSNPLNFKLFLLSSGPISNWWENSTKVTNP